jgi:hypothetical protein
MTTMPTISTLSGRAKFEYTLDGQGGFFIEYTGRPHISREFILKIQSTFKNKTVPGGFNVTDPILGGFGEWIKNNSRYTPRHGSHIAAVLKDLGIIKRSYDQKPIMLEF